MTAPAATPQSPVPELAPLPADHALASVNLELSRHLDLGRSLDDLTGIVDDVRPVLESAFGESLDPVHGETTLATIDAIVAKHRPKTTDDESFPVFLLMALGLVACETVIRLADGNGVPCPVHCDPSELSGTSLTLADVEGFPGVQIDGYLVANIGRKPAERWYSGQHALTEFWARVEAQRAAIASQADAQPATESDLAGAGHLAAFNQVAGPYPTPQQIRAYESGIAASGDPLLIQLQENLQALPDELRSEVFKKLREPEGRLKSIAAFSTQLRSFPGGPKSRAALLQVLDRVADFTPTGREQVARNELRRVKRLLNGGNDGKKALLAFVLVFVGFQMLGALIALAYLIVWLVG